MKNSMLLQNSFIQLHVFTSFLNRQTTGITRIPSCFRVIIYSIAYHTSLIFKQDFHSYRTQKVYIVGTSFSPLSHWTTFWSLWNIVAPTYLPFIILWWMMLKFWFFRKFNKFLWTAIRCYNTRTRTNNNREQEMQVCEKLSAGMN